MNASATASGPASRPDPGQDHPAPSVPPAIAHLFCFLTFLTRFGQKFFRSLAQPGAVPTAGVARFYGTDEPPVILRYILRGWFRAAALAEVLRRRALRGLDLTGPPPPGPPRRKPAGGTRDGARTPRPRQDVPFADGIPSQTVLLAWARRRPLDAALAAICRDLGLLPDNLGPQAWEKLQETILRLVTGPGPRLIVRLGRLRPIAAAVQRALRRRRRLGLAPAAPPVLAPLQELLRAAIATGPPEGLAPA